MIPVSIQSGSAWRYLRWLSVFIYLALCLSLALQKPGYHYDEALLVHGATHIVNLKGEPVFAHDAGSWIKIGGRFWPLMVVPYVGSVKDYLLVIPYFFFGSNYQVARLLAALLGAVGIAGLGSLANRIAGEKAAALACLLVAVQPSYIAQDLFDFGTVAPWMLFFGLGAAALAHYTARPSFAAAFWLGVTAGLGVWARLNYAWLLGAAVLAALVVLRQRAFPPLKHTAGLIAGFVIGLGPLLLYEIASRGATLRFLGANHVDGSWGDILSVRLLYLRLALLADTEMRGIWAAPRLPLWPGACYLAVIACSVLFCLALPAIHNAAETAWRRCVALTLLIFLAILFSSRNTVGQHHLVTLVPVAALVVVLGFRALGERYPRPASAAGAVLMAGYLAAALFLNFSALRGLERTGGVGPWSDAIFSIDARLERDYRGRPLKILDWGFQNNLYVISGARINSTESFWSADGDHSGDGKAWSEEITPGDLYLLHSPGTEIFIPPSQGFRQAMAKARTPVRVLDFQDRRGAPYAQLIEILPAGESKALR